MSLQDSEKSVRTLEYQGLIDRGIGNMSFVITQSL